MTRKIINLLLVLAFLFAIIFPFLFSDKSGGKISEVENRYLAKFPTILTQDMKLSPDIKTGFESWISDNVGGRSWSLQINKFITYKIFRIIPEQNVVGGKNNWLYLIPDFDLPECLNTNIPKQENLDLFKNSFSKISRDLKSDNIEYLVVLLPYKCNIYPEFMPDSMSPINEDSALKILDENLSGDPSFDFSTALDELRAAKQNGLVYYKAHDRSHWNQYGAFIGYTVLMEQAKKHLPRLRVLTENDFVITPITINTTTPWGFYTQEKDIQYSIIGGYQAISDKTFLNTYDFVSKDPWNSYNYYKNPNSSLPKAVIVGDSFVWMFLLPNIAESFSELVFIHYSDLDNLNKIIEIFRPDIVINAGLGSSIVAFSSYVYEQPNPNAQIVSTDTPIEVNRDEFYDITIVVKNTGTESWTEDKEIRLCVFVNGQDLGYRIYLPDDIEVKTGAEYKFTLYDLQAPSESDFFLQYQMVDETIEYFGEKKRVDVIVN